MDFNLEDYFTADIAIGIFCWGIFAIALFCLGSLIYSYIKACKREKGITQKVDDKIHEIVVNQDAPRDEVRKANFRWLYISYDIADRVDDFMKKNHLIDEEMAKKLGTDVQYVVDLKKGGMNLTLSELVKLSHVMGHEYLRVLDL